jgi:hypothetical protein
MINNILNIRLILNSLDSLKSIYYSIFLIFIFKTNFLIDINIKNKQDHDFLKYIKQVQNNISEKYNIFNKEIIIDEKYLFEINKFFKLNDTTIINYDELIDEIFKIYLHNENLLDIKDYIKHYNNKLLSDWIYKLLDNNNNNNLKSIFDGNVNINSYLDLFKTGTKFGLQTNDYIYEIVLIQNFINNKFKINPIINTDILVNNIQLNNSLFDIIFFDFPTDIHNLIYTQCCDKIKKLKIRGTRSECLLLQLISLSLNPNGEAILIIPESILYSDSKQVIETRKYLFNNFNIHKIVHIDQNIYYNNINRDLKSITNTLKNCIFYFKNNGKTNTINISKIKLDKTKIIEEHIYEINSINDEYSFYYKDYLHLSNKTELNFKYVNDLFNFYDGNTSDKTLINESLIILNRYYNSNNNFIKISKIESECDYSNSYLIREKEESVDNFYFLYYLENVIKKDPEYFIKGRNNKFDSSKIKEYKIPILSLDKQNIICDYLPICEKIITATQENIDRYTLLKNSVLENIPTTNMISLEDIVDLVQEQTDNKLISILRNSLYAGDVNLYQGNLLNSNSYYLVPKNNNFILQYIYYYLKYKEPYIKELSKLTQQNNLIKSNLLSIEIPNINISLQNDIINVCTEFDNNINVLVLNNKTIKNINIFDIVTKINSY